MELSFRALTAVLRGRTAQHHAVRPVPARTVVIRQAPEAQHSGVFVVWALRDGWSGDGVPTAGCALPVRRTAVELTGMVRRCARREPASPPKARAMWCWMSASRIVRRARG